MSNEKQTAWLEFLAKLITPITIIILVLSFKSTVEERLSQASEVSVLGSSFKFESAGFKGQLSTLELYYFINAKLDSGAFLDQTAFEGKELASIYLLETKGMVKIQKVNLEGMDGEFINLKLTPSGEALAQNLGL